MKSYLLLAALAGVVAAPAFAEDQCGAKVTHRYSETRAAFSDVLAGCDKDGACYLSASKIDKSLPANFSHQLRILQPKGGGQLGLKLTAVEPMADLKGAMVLSYGSTKVDLGGALETRGNVVNDYYVKDGAKSDELARTLIDKARTVRWLYQDEKGAEVIADMPLRGASSALEWVQCMAKPKG
jgi:hypothetical protein